MHEYTQPKKNVCTNIPHLTQLQCIIIFDSFLFVSMYKLYRDCSHITSANV